jgi:ferric-dicitrate binding protein FerR (iron transport regulator)
MYRNAFDEWRAADKEAREMEAKLAAAWQRYDSRNGPPPSAELMESVSLLRSKANEKLTRAMLAMTAARHSAERPES